MLGAKNEGQVRQFLLKAVVLYFFSKSYSLLLKTSFFHLNEYFRCLSVQFLPGYSLLVLVVEDAPPGDAYFLPPTGFLFLQ